MRVLVLVTTVSMLLATSGRGQGPQVSYPEGYRDWTHVKSMVIQPGHTLYDAFGGIHHVYANDKALASLREPGKKFADGSVLVFDLMEAKTEANAVTEGPRKVLGVMEKNQARWPETGGWGFEAFKADTPERAVTDARTQCFECHKPRAGSDFVYGELRK
jgi:hypothetical protein